MQKYIVLCVPVMGGMDYTLVEVDEDNIFDSEEEAKKHIRENEYVCR